MCHVVPGVHCPCSCHHVMLWFTTYCGTSSTAALLLISQPMLVSRVCERLPHCRTHGKHMVAAYLLVSLIQSLHRSSCVKHSWLPCCRFLAEYDTKIGNGPHKYKRAAEFLMNTCILGIKDIVRGLIKAKEEAAGKLTRKEAELTRVRLSTPSSSSKA